MRFHLIIASYTPNSSQQTSSLPLAMADPQLLPPPPPPPPRSTFPMLYYGLVVVATAAIILVLYNLIVMKWCNHLSDQRPAPQRTSRRQRPIPTWRIENSTLNSVATFKYEGDGKGGDSECSVCLSVFEEGEEIRQLPKCKHYFHAPCIDMWLYSHMDCPLCRSPVELSPLLRQPEESEHSREGLLPGGAASIV